jgi:hypothetical protein
MYIYSFVFIQQGPAVQSQNMCIRAAPTYMLHVISATHGACIHSLHHMDITWTPSAYIATYSMAQAPPDCIPALEQC